MKRNTQLILNDVKNNIELLKQDANNNVSCKGWTIVFGNASINIPPDDREEFWEELEEIRKANDVWFEVNDYDDLVITTSEFESEE